MVMAARSRVSPRPWGPVNLTRKSRNLHLLHGLQSDGQELSYTYANQTKRLQVTQAEYGDRPVALESCQKV